MPPPAELTGWAAAVGNDPTARHPVMGDLVKRGRLRGQTADLAEDCVQDALTKVLTLGSEGRLPAFRDYDHFRRYVLRAAVNRGRELFRSRRRVFQQWDEEAVTEAPEGVSAEAVRQAIDALPAVERRVIEGYYFEGLTLDELADRLFPPDGRSDNARRLDAFKARRAGEDRLRAALGDDTGAG